MCLMGAVLSGDSLSDEISVLDLFVVIAENWVLLVIGPLLAGIITYGALAIGGRQSYEATALLNIDAREAGLLQSASVLDGALRNSAFLVEHRGEINTVRRDFQTENLRVSKDNESGFYSVSVKAEDPDHAVEMVELIIDGLIARSVPSKNEQERLQTRIQNIERSVDILESSLAKTLVSSDVTNGTSNGGRDYGEVIVAILGNLEQRRQDLDRLAWELRGSVLPDDVIQPPAISSVAPKSKMTVVVAVTLGVGFVLLLLAFVREGLRKATNDAGRHEQINRIRRAFWLAPFENRTHS
jgi:capsular polysaccharide biosynthesis protein